MRPLTLCTLLLIATAGLCRGDDLPVGVPSNYRLLYSQDFIKPESLSDFSMTDPSAWAIAPAQGEDPAALELKKQSQYAPPHRSPLNIALIRDLKVGDCIIDADCLQTGKEYGHRDMVFFFGYQDPAHYYYAHIATKGDDHANNIFIVDGAPRLKISTKTNAGNNWGLGVWHKVRVVRRVSDGVVQVYFDDLEHPIMEAKNEKFGAGWVGFGSFDDTGKVARIRVYGRESEAKAVQAFPTAKK
jgi:hypothetical protein